MKAVLSAVLLLALSAAISCSSGGGSDANGVALEKTQGGGTIQGQWQGEGLTLVVTDSSLTLSANCPTGQIQASSAIKISATDVTILENKQAGEPGEGKCNINLVKNMVVPYAVTGTQLVLTIGDKKVTMARVGAAPAPAPGNGGGGEVKADVAFFSAANCQGNVTAYTIGMNCASLNNSGNVMSLMQGANQCQNMNQGASAVAVCESINQQTQGQGRQ